MSNTRIEEEIFEEFNDLPVEIKQHVLSYAPDALLHFSLTTKENNALVNHAIENHLVKFPLKFVLNYANKSNKDLDFMQNYIEKFGSQLSSTEILNASLATNRLDKFDVFLFIKGLAHLERNPDFRKLKNSYGVFNSFAHKHNKLKQYAAAESFYKGFLAMLFAIQYHHISKMDDKAFELYINKLAGKIQQIKLEVYPRLEKDIYPEGFFAIVKELATFTNKLEFIKLLITNMKSCLAEKSAAEKELSHQSYPINLSGLCLDNLDLSNCCLKSAKLLNSNLILTNLTGATLKYADLRGANLISTNLSNIDATFAKLWYANLTNADISGSSLYGANMCNSTLVGVNIVNARIDSAVFSNATIMGTRFLLANDENFSTTFRHFLPRKIFLDLDLFKTAVAHFDTTQFQAVFDKKSLSKEGMSVRSQFLEYILQRTREVEDTSDPQEKLTKINHFIKLLEQLPETRLFKYLKPKISFFKNDHVKEDITTYKLRKEVLILDRQKLLANNNNALHRDPEKKSRKSFK